MKTIKSLLLALLLGFIIVVSSGVQAMQRTNNEDIEAAQRGMLSEDERAQEEALSLFLVMREENLIQEAALYQFEAIQAAQQGMRCENSWIQFLALNLFCKLVTVGQGVDAAREAAQQGILSGNYYVRRQAEALQEIIPSRVLRLFVQLAKFDQGIEEAIRAAERGMMRRD